jgi:hypothetical protein
MYYTRSLLWYYVIGFVMFVSNWVYAAFGVPESIVPHGGQSPSRNSFTYYDQWSRRCSAAGA